MMNTEEELTTAADAFTEQYLLDSAVDDTKVSLCGHQGQLPASRRALDTVKDEDDDTEHTITVNGADTTTPTSRDQEDAASTVGTSPSVKPQRRRSWFGGRSREEEEAVMQRHQSASWFTQCRCVVAVVVVVARASRVRGCEARAETQHAVNRQHVHSMPYRMHVSALIGSLEGCDDQCC